LRGKFPPPVEYSIGDTRVRRPYFLADGIYPKSPFFVQAYSGPNSEKKKMFNAVQEAERKEVERAFGVLQSKFRFLSAANSVELWDKEHIGNIVTASAILQNMAGEDRLAKRQGGELSGVEATEGTGGILVGAEDGAQFEWERAAAPRVRLRRLVLLLACVLQTMTSGTIWSGITCGPGCQTLFLKLPRKLT
jgi:hypothetical protein